MAHPEQRVRHPFMSFIPVSEVVPYRYSDKSCGVMLDEIGFGLQGQTQRAAYIISHPGTEVEADTSVAAHVPIAVLVEFLDVPRRESDTGDTVDIKLASINRQRKLPVEIQHKSILLLVAEHEIHLRLQSEEV